jgi:imidazolonepropionase-like amidohydrolase
MVGFARTLSTLLCISLTCVAAQRVVAAESPDSEARIVIRADRILDGVGGVFGGRDVHVVGERIVAIAPQRGRADYDLKGMTLMPGWIDTHVHVAARKDRLGCRVLPNELGEETAEEAALATAANAHATLMGGFTLVQSVGDRLDVPVKQSVDAGLLPGPRILTSIDLLNGHTAGSPEQVREWVRATRDKGADVIKLFADGHGTLDSDQIDAACAEARANGLRAVVHATTLPAIKAAAEAGCTTVEHGSQIDESTLDMLRARGVYFDPNLNIVPNYAREHTQLPDPASYDAKSIEQMPDRYRDAVRMFQRALRSGVKIVFGSDAVAGAHGNNSDEFIYRVIDGGQDPMDAIVSATSLSAESLGLGDRLGKIAPGYLADLVAVEGNPLDDIRVVKKVMFVVVGGRIVKHVRNAREARVSAPQYLSSDAKEAASAASQCHQG